MPLKRVRAALLPAAALAAAGVTIWLDALGGINVGRDDLCPAVLTTILSVWALLAHFYRRLTRESQEVEFEHAVEAVTKGFRAGTEAVLGDGRHGKGGQRLP